jgi:nucleolar protein 15
LDRNKIVIIAMSSKKNASEKEDGLSNVVYLGHIPHGFYEKQMREFFLQFGQVVNLRISRNKKTGKSKHYGFIQFHTPDIASIVAEAMDGYHFFGQKLEAHVMKKDQVHAELFKGANRTFKRIPWKEIETRRHNKERSEAEEKKRKGRFAKRNESRKKKTLEAGIEYDFDESAINDMAGSDEDAQGSKKKKKKESVQSVEKTKSVLKKKHVKASKSVERRADESQRRVTRSKSKSMAAI